MEKIDKLEWPAIEGYLERLRMQADVDIKRVREIFYLGGNLCSEQLTGIFISNYVENDGKQQFKDLWLFSENCVIEAINFSKSESPKVEMTIFSHNIYFLAVETKNYEFSKTATDDSRLHIYFHTRSQFRCDFTAFGQNCDILKSTFEKYMKNNLARGETSSLFS